jgi:hypothetical protein
MKANVVKAGFTAAAERCLGKAKYHVEMAKAHAMMAEEHEEKSGAHKFHKKAKMLHEGEAEGCTETGTIFAQCARDAGAEMMSRKAAGLDNSDELMPLAVSVIHGDTPVNKLVLRPGMREPANVPDPFQKLVSID